ncbi:MAG: SDR family NAD(P)-dependent oxidoreductase [Fidelibacterota bacterium]
MNISEKTIVITGAGGNVGRQLTQALHKAGATVIAIRRGPSTTVMETSRRLFTVKCDLTNEHAVRQLVRSIQHTCGNIQAWVNVAGGFTAAGEVESTGRNVWTQMLSVNFITTLNCCQAVLPHMKENRSGEIINFGSYPAETGMAKAAPYAVAKAAIHALTKSIAQEGKAFGIKARVVAPETIDTPANREAMPDADWSSWVSIDDITRVVLNLLESSAPTDDVLIPVKKDASGQLPEPDTSLLNIFSSEDVPATPEPETELKPPVVSTESPKSKTTEPEPAQPDNALEDLLVKAAQVKAETEEVREEPAVTQEETTPTKEAPTPSSEETEAAEPEESEATEPEAVSEEKEEEKESEPEPEDAVEFEGEAEEPLFNSEDLKQDTTPGNELDMDDDLFADSRVFTVADKKEDSAAKTPEPNSEEPVAAEQKKAEEKTDYQYNQGFKEATNRLLEIFKKPTEEPKTGDEEQKEEAIDPDNASFELVEHLVMRYEYDKALDMLAALERRGAPAEKIKEARQEIEASRLQDTSGKDEPAGEEDSSEEPTEKGDLSQYISEVTAQRAKEKAGSGKKKS